MRVRRVTIAGVLFLALATGCGGNGGSGGSVENADQLTEPAILRVVQRFNEEQNLDFRIEEMIPDEGDMLVALIDDTDPDIMWTATITITRTDEITLTARFEPGNLTQGIAPFAESASGYVCIDFDEGGGAYEHQRGIVALATYHC